MAKTVRVIPASPKIFRSEVTAEPRRRRTAGYARVSTDHEEQASSYEIVMKCRWRITRTTSKAAPTGISSACIRTRESAAPTQRSVTASIR